MFKDRRLTIFVAITLLMLLGTLVRGTVSYFSDIESSTGNSPSAWISRQWTQTTKTDIDAGVLTGVNTFLSSGDVILKPGDSSTTAYFFLLWDNSSSLPSGWTDVSASGQAFYQRFPRGAATYGDTGGTATHSHTRTLSSVGTLSGTTAVLSGATNRSSGTHINHTIAAGSTATASSLPAYRNLRVIRYTGVPATIPAGAIAIFDGALPAGWTQYSAQNGYFVRGEAAAQTGITGGSNTHNHTVSGTPAASNQYQVVATTAPTTTVAASGHTHTIGGTTHDGDTRPPFITVVLAKADSDTTIPYGMIAMFSATPTGAWSVLSGTGGAFESRFIVGDSSYGATDGAGTHIHSNLTVTSSNSTTTGAASTTGPNASAAANGHNHSVTLSFAGGSSLPPYRDVIFARAIYPTSGTLASQVSQVLDTTVAGSIWESLFWDETLPANTDITFEVRASDTSFLKTDVAPAWTAAGGTSPVSSGLPAGRYKQCEPH